MRPLPIASTLIAVCGLIAAEAAPTPGGVTATTTAVAEAPPPEAEVAPVPDYAMSADEQAQVTAAIELAIVHGLPDAKGATLHLGSLWIAEPRERGRRSHHFSMGDEDRNEERPAGVAENAGRFAGLHARLPDGAWLVNLARLVKPGPEVTVTTGKIEEIKPAEFRQTLAGKARHAPGPEQLAEVEKQMPAEVRPALRVMFRWAGAMERLGFGNDVALPVVSLVRAGVPDAAELTLAFAFMQAQMRQMQEDAASAAQPFLLTDADREGQQAQMMQRMRRMGGKDAQREMFQGMRLDPLPLATRRALADWFRKQMAEPRSGVAPERAATAIAGLLGDQADPGLAELVRLFRERATLPETVAAESDLATRLSVWEPRDRGNGEDVDEAEPEIPAEALANLPAEMKAQMEEQRAERERAKKAPRIAEADLPGLIALLGDTRASRWLDTGGNRWGPGEAAATPRTIGDNALRAATVLLTIDPRRLAGHDIYRPWNPAERAAAAAAVQAWWQANQGKPLAEVLAAAVPSLDLRGIAVLIAERPAAERPVLVAALVKQWQAKPPVLGEDDDAIGTLLGKLGAEPALEPLIKAWPVEGKAATLLAIWHARHGDPAPLERAFEESLAAGDDDHEGDQRLRNVLAAVSAQPTAAQLARLLSTIGDWQQPASRRLMGVTLQQGNWQSWDQGIRAILGDNEHDPDDQVARQALHHAVLAAMLADRRPVPADLAKVQGGGMIMVGDRIWLHSGRPDGDEKLTLPADLRTCDLAAWHMAGNAWQYRQDDGQPPEDKGFPIGAALAERDAALAPLQIRLGVLLQKAFAAAKLPAAAIPAGGAPAGDEKALF
jgi:hypothetical protein